MTRHFVTFGSDEFGPALDLSLSAAGKYFDTVTAWRPADIRASRFYHDHRRTLDERRGNGYWLWKPYLIREVLGTVASGDVVMYLDAGAALTSDPLRLFEICQREEIMLFAGHYAGVDGAYACATWTKRDCFVLMGCDEPRYHSAPMADASVILLQNTERARNFVEEWLSYATNPAILMDGPSIHGEPLPGFVDHRHDQSILSLLAMRHGLQLFRGPSQFGNHCKALAWRIPGEWLRAPYGAHGSFESSAYGTVIDHHRLRVILTSKADPFAPPGLRDVMVKARPSGAPHVVRAFAEGGNVLDEVNAIDGILYVCAAMSGPVEVLVVGPTLVEELDQLRAYWPESRITAVDSGLPPAAVAGIRLIQGSALGRDGVWAGLRGARFDVIICQLPGRSLSVASMLRNLDGAGLLRGDVTVCWSNLECADEFGLAGLQLKGVFGERVRVQKGMARAARSREPRMVGLLQLFDAVAEGHK